MPWNGKRTLKPCIVTEKCVCSQCFGDCPDKPTVAVRCDECLDMGPNGRHPFVDSRIRKPV